MTKIIPLTQEKFALVDDKDYEWLSQWRWYASRRRHTWYAFRKESKSPYTTIAMHVQIMKPQKGNEVDHKDGDGLNNQRGNLREATRGQNSSNRRKQANNTSGYRGVYRSRGKWMAKIQINGKAKHIYSGDSAEEAARTYDRWAHKLFGEFAQLNFPQ